MTNKQYSPLRLLVLARLREFLRQPVIIFWILVFPILIAITLAIAFRNRPAEKVVVGVERSEGSEAAAAALNMHGNFVVQLCQAQECRLSLRRNKIDIIVVASAGPHYEYVYDPTRPESARARIVIDDALQRAAGRRDVAEATDRKITEPGGRYIDFLLPGLIGMGLMGGGLWGVSAVIVDMRIRKLLKLFIATPMKKHQFLASVMINRFIFMIPEIAVLLLFARFGFGIHIQGSFLAVMFLILLGAFTFCGIGLLVASRANNHETLSGLMNLVLIPMWVLSGIFFTSDRFPDWIQPIIKALPLTPLISSLRAVILEGNSLFQLWPQVVILAFWGVATFILAMRSFRWT